jgi:hypothetical protein
MPRLVPEHILTVPGAHLQVAAFDAEGRLYVGGEHLNAVLVYDAATFELARKIPFRGSGLALGLAPGGARLAVGATTGAVFDLATDARLGDFKTKRVTASTYPWAPDGQHFARHDGNQILIHDAAGALVQKLALPKQKLSGEACVGAVSALTWVDAGTVVALATYTRYAAGPDETDWERKSGFATCRAGGDLALGPLRDGYADLRALPERPGAPLAMMSVAPSALGSRAPRSTTVELIDLATRQTRKQIVLPPQPSLVWLALAIDADTALVGWFTPRTAYDFAILDLRDGSLAPMEDSEPLTLTPARRADGLLAFVSGPTVTLGRLAR